MLFLKKEGLDFIEALEAMAKRTGVEIERRDKGTHQINQRLLDANKLASVYFHNVLLTSREAQRAREYLVQRGISQAIIRDFQLGYAPKLSRELFDHLSDQGFTAKDYVSAGLGVKGESGEIKEIFRGRVVFPIRDMQAHVIGFGGRTLVDSRPKYINSPQTPIFEKSIQAKFLIPMAVSLGFGVLFSTFVTLILVPCTYITVENLKSRVIKK